MKIHINVISVINHVIDAQDLIQMIALIAKMVIIIKVIHNLAYLVTMFVKHVNLEVVHSAYHVKKELTSIMFILIKPWNAKLVVMDAKNAHQEVNVINVKVDIC